MFLKCKFVFHLSVHANSSPELQFIFLNLWVGHVYFSSFGLFSNHIYHLLNIQLGV